MTDKNNAAAAPDTGHVWDENLRELTNQPPNWWMISFYLSGLFLLVYFVLYPAIPLVNSATKGVLGWTQMKRFNDSVQEIEMVRAPYETKLKGMTAAAILADTELANYAAQTAKVMFSDRCSACHGAGGAGIPGYPVLADDDWLFGGSIETITQSITQGRAGMMPAYGAMLNEQQLDDLAQHLLAMSKGGEHAPGKELFISQGCTGCHGTDGSGLQAMGAAKLTDVVWRFMPANIDSVKYTIKHGINVAGSKEARSAVMPAFNTQLSASDINKLAVYVYKLGGGQ